jgi:hypothetical protein
MLIGEPHRLLALLPRPLAFFEQPIREPVALLQLLVEEAALLFGRVQAVFECLTHVCILA